MKNWRSILVKKSDTLISVVNKINQTGYRCAIIVDKNKKLLGTLTDGDFRDKILSLKNRNLKVSNFMNKRPIFSFITENKNEREKKILKNSIFFLPILNQKKQVLGIDYFSNFLKTHENKKGIVFIMAGGKGLRMRPLTNNTPKPLLKINGKPMLQLLLESLKNQGFNKIYISVNYLHKKIEKFIKNYKSELNIKIFKEKKELGTAGSLFFLKKENLKDPIIIINSDVITNYDLNKLIEKHIKSKKKLSILSKNVSFKLPYGVIEGNNRKFGNFNKIQEKPNLNFSVMSGVNCISPSILKVIKNNHKLDINDLVCKIKKKEIQVLNSNFYWIDVGEKIDLDYANENFKDLYY